MLANFNLNAWNPESANTNSKYYYHHNIYICKNTCTTSHSYSQSSGVAFTALPLGGGLYIFTLQFCAFDLVD